MTRWWVVVAALLLAACGTSTTTTLDTDPVTIGRELVRANNCANCHSVVADGLGPSWRGLAGRRSDDEIAESIRDPQGTIVAGYETVRMPTFDLDESEIQAIVEYLQSITG